MRALIAVMLLALSFAASAQERRYAVLSLVGDKLTIVEREVSTGSRLDRNTRQSLDLPNSALDRTMLLAIEDSLRERDRNAQVVLLAPRDPSLFAAVERAMHSGAGMQAVLAELRDVLAGAKATHLVLVTKHRAPARVQVDDGHIGSGWLEGLGFYLDPSTRLDIRERRETSTGYIAPYAYFKVSLVDLASGRVVAEENVSQSRATGDVRSVTPWLAMSNQDKAAMLQSMVREGARQAVPQVVR